ncbi:DUF4129 domain-containing protein [Pedobacter rhodius]|uniref:DUF4129 domain-containing protein n=1 Tax=Pedobacter rhodius TaxID=3004098 RepID=A0ABT4KXY7_9SPHI|nr:DUF4129 domain-containing protein [Pedobacter sp. SJ11]MCZ4223805.1 DUF4129 domain-containing protein [Pedobacter sp. SJ11]
MQKITFKFLILFCLLFASGYSYAQNLKPQVKQIVKSDTSQITPAKFNKEALQAYAEQKEFQYDDSLRRDLSLWDRFWMWFWRMVSKLFTGAASNPISKYFFIGIGVAILLYIIIKIIGSENIFARKSKETILPYDILNENIHEIDYDTELRKLIEQGKYRLAVRLLYLKTLKKLSDAGIIQWQPEKTNYNYFTEISESEIKQAFGSLTHQFDYIWYGDFPVDAQKFEPINQSFNHFNSKIK